MNMEEQFWIPVAGILFKIRIGYKVWMIETHVPGAGRDDHDSRPSACIKYRQKHIAWLILFTCLIRGVCADIIIVCRLLKTCPEKSLVASLEMLISNTNEKVAYEGLAPDNLSESITDDAIP